MTTLEGRRRPTIGESGVYWGLGNVVSSVFRRTFLVNKNGEKYRYYFFIKVIKYGLYGKVGWLSEIQPAENSVNGLACYINTT